MGYCDLIVTKFCQIHEVRITLVANLIFTPIKKINKRDKIVLFVVFEQEE